MKLSEEAILAEEKIAIDKWERIGVEFTRRDGELLRDGNGCYHVRARMMTKGRGCGLVVGWMLFMASRNDQRNDEPWQIQYGDDVLWYNDEDVWLATLKEYLFRTRGAFGGTPWLFVGLLLVACVRLSIGLWWLGPAVLIAFLIFTYGNYKLWFR